MRGTWVLDRRTGRHVWQPGAERPGAAEAPPALSLVLLRRARCRAKTADGNVYRTGALAAAVAALCRQGGGDPVEAFRCAVCGRWHTGKRREGSGDGAGAGV